jgi:hypothetical protein
MKIVRQTPTELVVLDSSLSISAIFLVAGLFVLYFVIFQGDRRAAGAAGISLLVALAWLRRSTFTFSAALQRIDWKRLRWFRVTGGTIPFSEVQSINIEATSGGKGVPTYRLAIATPHSIVPMSDVYTPGEEHFQSLRDTIQQFVKPAASSAPVSGFSAASASITVNSDAARTAALNDSIRGLLQQGRKVDAILLVRQTEHLDLTEATFRVNHIEAQLKSDGVGR